MKEFYKVCQKCHCVRSEVSQKDLLCISPSRFGGILGVVFLNF